MYTSPVALVERWDKS